MRALILVLITLNLALAAWSWHYDKLSVHDDISLAAEIPLPEVVELDEAEDTAGYVAVESSDSPMAVNAASSKPDAESTPAEIKKPAAAPKPPVIASAPPAVVAVSVKEAVEAPVSPSPKADSPKPRAVESVVAQAKAPQSGCLVYGPFERSIDAAQLVQRMQLDGYAAEFSEREERVSRGRWVLFPVANTADAEELIGAFHDSGLKDFGLVRKSPVGMAVSAGLYAGERSLNARLDSLMSAGFTPEVDELYREGSFYQVTVEEPPANPEKYGKFLACNA